MAEVIWTEPALNDLNDIADYIAINNIAVAQKLVGEVFSKTNRLEKFPESGRIPEEIAELGYREIIVNPCRIFYKFEQNLVYVLHVLRQERDIRKFIINEIGTA